MIILHQHVLTTSKFYVSKYTRRGAIACPRATRKEDVNLVARKINKSGATQQYTDPHTCIMAIVPTLLKTLHATCNKSQALDGPVTVARIGRPHWFTHGYNPIG